MRCHGCKMRINMWWLRCARCHALNLHWWHLVALCIALSIIALLILNKVIPD
ncbi:MAG: hypothetical protein JO360_06310 [Acidobacteria bacterium]|nr:hypothetical protein [Acidobacteriota bacterium]